MFKNILVALKFSPGGLHALKTAAELAQATSARLCVFHALDYHLRPLGEDAPEVVAARDEAMDRYELLAKPLLAGVAESEFLCQTADPSVEFCKLAREMGADLIVFGCHQRQGLCKSRIDYTGMTILETAPCAVMLVPLFDISPSCAAPTTEATPEKPR